MCREVFLCEKDEEVFEDRVASEDDVETSRVRDIEAPITPVDDEDEEHTA